MQGTPYPPDELLSMDESAAHLGISPYTFRTATAYLIPSIWIGGRKGFFKADIDAFATKRNQQRRPDGGWLNCDETREARRTAA